MNLLSMIAAMKDAGIDAAQILSAVETVERQRLEGQRVRVRKHREVRYVTDVTLQEECNAADVTKEKVSDFQKKTSEPSPKKTPLTGGQKKGSPAGTRLPSDWILPAEWRDWAVAEGLDPAAVGREGDRFGDHWRGKAGADGRKADWLATWRNWVRRAIEYRGEHTPVAAMPTADLERERMRSTLRNYQPPRGFWPPNYGSRPGEEGCLIPADILAEFGYSPPPRDSPENVVPIGDPANLLKRIPA